MNKESEDERQLSRREWARKLRREAYQRAKQRRASDPTYLAMKEEAKRRRREASRIMKERKKAVAAKMKLDRTEPKSAAQRARATADERLKKLVRPASELEQASKDPRR